MNLALSPTVIFVAEASSDQGSAPGYAAIQWGRVDSEMLAASIVRAAHPAASLTPQLGTEEE